MVPASFWIRVIEEPELRVSGVEKTRMLDKDILVIQLSTKPNQGSKRNNLHDGSGGQMPATQEEKTKHVEILLAEDNPTDAYLIRELLKRSKYSVHLSVVYNGAKALAYLQHEGPYLGAPDPDLVLLDLDLPKITGWDVLGNMKQDPQMSQIPVLVVTASDSEKDKWRAHALGADEYLVKPMNMFEFPSLVWTVDRLVGD